MNRTYGFLRWVYSNEFKLIMFLKIQNSQIHNEFKVDKRLTDRFIISFK